MSTRTYYCDECMLVRYQCRKCEISIGPTKLVDCAGYNLCGGPSPNKLQINNESMCIYHEQKAQDRQTWFEEEGDENMQAMRKSDGERAQQVDELERLEAEKREREAMLDRMRRRNANRETEQNAALVLQESAPTRPERQPARHRRYEFETYSRAGPSQPHPDPAGDARRQWQWEEDEMAERRRQGDKDLAAARAKSAMKARERGRMERRPLFPRLLARVKLLESVSTATAPSTGHNIPVPAEQPRSNNVLPWDPRFGDPELPWDPRVIPGIEQYKPRDEADMYIPPGYARMEIGDGRGMVVAVRNVPGMPSLSQSSQQSAPRPSPHRQITPRHQLTTPTSSQPSMHTVSPSSSRTNPSPRRDDTYKPSTSIDGDKSPTPNGNCSPDFGLQCAARTTVTVAESSSMAQVMATLTGSPTTLDYSTLQSVPQGWLKSEGLFAKAKKSIY